MSVNNDEDDDFGGFEEASYSTNNDVVISNNFHSTLKEAITKIEKIPDWVLNSSFNSNNPINQSNNHTLASDLSSFDEGNRSHESLIKNLQDELTKTKEQLIDQQTNFLQLQSQHRQDLEEKTNSFNSSITLVYKEFVNLLKQGLLQQREVCYKEFKALLEKQNAEQEKAISRKLEDMHTKYESYFSEKFEKRLAEFQENLIKLSQSEYEDTELKIKKIVNTMLKDEKASEKAALKQQLDQIKKELKQDTEKSVNQYFISHNEDFKEQIKSGVMQEHLIHKDLINSKLEKLFKSSEEKRRITNTLFARHMSGLNFFVDNAHKQLTILKEAHKDMLKNKDIIDFFGENGEKSGDYSTSNVNNNLKESLMQSVSSLSLSDLTQNGNKIESNRNNSRDNLFFNMPEDDQLIDEDLLN